MEEKCQNEEWELSKQEQSKTRKAVFFKLKVQQNLPTKMVNS
jgi:hypothetical protein